MGGRWQGGSGWGTHVNPWLIHVNVWQKPPQYCKVISLQLIKKKSSWVTQLVIIVSPGSRFTLRKLVFAALCSSIDIPLHRKKKKKTWQVK